MKAIRTNRLFMGQNKLIPRLQTLLQLQILQVLDRQLLASKTRYSLRCNT